MDYKIDYLLDINKKVKRWPKKRYEKDAVLHYIQSKFEKNHKYSEKEVNAIIMEWHLFNDFALLRREMVDNSLIKRTADCREYWIEERT
jgi:hypothetical protein